MLDKNDYKIYSLSSSANPDLIRYIGLTRQTLVKRLKDHLYDCRKMVNHRHKWLNKVLKENNTIKISLIETDLTLEAANQKEIFYIKLFKSFGAKLVNGTLGGDGVVLTKEQAVKRSSYLKGKPGRMKGKKLSKKNIERLKLLHTGNKYNLGYKHSKEACLRLSEQRRGRPNPKHYSPVLQYDKEGNFIKKWDSIKSVIQEYKCSNSLIIRCCQNKCKSAKNFIWKYANK